MALASVPVASVGAKLDSTIAGVRLGVQTYSYRALPMDGIVDSIIQAMTETGLAECELFAPQIEPQVKARDELRKWRLEVPLDHFRNVRKKFDAAGINLYVYNLSFNDSFTDDEIDRGFQHANALGVHIISASSTLSVAKRIAPFAEKHKMYLAVHNHANLKDSNEFATPASFLAAVALSKYIKINLDIGHFTAANFDAVAFIREHHDRITNLHLKDRKKNGGQNVEWGQGDTPIKAVLQLLKTQQYPIPAYIEYEYSGKGNCVDEVKKCFVFAKQVLA